MIAIPVKKWRQGLSVVVPTLNEQDTIESLINRTKVALANSAHIKDFEIIIIDDNSIDRTFKIGQKISKRNSYVRILRKKGKAGKAFSLIEGFKTARYDLVCFIDADLQYPPESIPLMVERIAEGGADVVVANRRYKGIPMLQRLASCAFRHFTYLVHRKAYDTQSGLKVFRHDLLTYFDLQPTRWTFDMEFLAYAETIGSKIDTVDIEFKERVAGESKLGLMGSSYEIVKQSLKLRFKPYDYLPFNDEITATRGSGFFYRGQAYIPHSKLNKDNTALQRMLLWQRLMLTIFITLSVMAFLVEWHTALLLLIAILTTLYFSDLLFDLLLVIRGFSHTSEVHISEEDMMLMRRIGLPTYTILCPLYRESAVLPQFVKALSEMDYDFDKLQVLLLLEEDDKETIEVARRMNLPSYIEIVVVPHSYPKTKPKACNYGLKIATGEYLVIYDAEDIPNPTQLKQAYLAFERLPENVVCVQSKLNFYNPHQNLLTRVFTAEYSLWFDLILTGLQSINAPIPLGGTSNHFKTMKLRELGGWDAFNVTEDADLGIRLVKNGYRTAVIDAVTLEEANSHLMNWFHQRARWIKGYMQTYLVHSRHMRDFPKGRVGVQALTFQLVIGGKILSMFINPFMWVLTFVYFGFRPIVGTTIDGFFPSPILYLAVSCLIFGNFLYLYYYMIGCAKHGHYELIKYAFLIPFYWLAMSIAGWMALVELIRQPHHWNKTKHGLHFGESKEVDLTNAEASGVKG